MSMPQRQRRTQLYDAPPAQPSAEFQTQENIDAPVPPGREVLATNTGVRLACTMAAMCSLFAAFLCWAERESRVIRRFAVQSAALLVVHVLLAAMLAGVGFVCSAVPYFGFLVSLTCWLVYIAAVIVLLAFRFRLMECGWHGRRFDLPLLEKIIRKYY